ncbi:DUF262 domain-containing protein [Tautonia rosea]|uniref:DUF262 domain-containing protein n=1 Tax=Tautonia rosea TaxID=2728037 RepID=UPI00147411FB|nr:DUF262 domain-containing protein [Tautonia rosea]
MKTSASNKKIREIISMVKTGKLIPKPEFQRRLVWTHKDKDHFLDTILRGYPFPEIYLADGDVDLDSGEGTQLLVDGLQRVSTILEYFEGSPNLRLLTIPPYRELEEDQKKEFLQYDVAVRDLGSANRRQIIDTFKRINATKYSLLDIEVNNAVYAGELKKFAERIAEDDFFIRNRVFDARDFKRMGDLRYTLTLIITFLQGYFNRDDDFGELLDRFNDEFPREQEIEQRLRFCFDLVSECGFEAKSRIWKKADLFTVLVELDKLRQSGIQLPQPLQLLEKLTDFYEQIDETNDVGSSNIPAIYYKASLQATNDRVNRLRRGFIIGGLLQGRTYENILNEIEAEKLI